MAVRRATREAAQRAVEADGSTAVLWATTLNPGTIDAATSLLEGLGAPPRLLRHVALVGEAGELLLRRLARLQVPVDEDFVRVGIVLHDVGKILVPAELDAAGSAHEPAGQDLLLSHGVSPDLARVCLTHARWASMSLSLAELLIALADKLWKGVRNEKLEQAVIDRIASAVQKDRWDLFVDLDTIFEEIAAGGADRLARSKV